MEIIHENTFLYVLVITLCCLMTWASTKSEVLLIS